MNCPLCDAIAALDLDPVRATRRAFFAGMRQTLRALSLPMLADGVVWPLNVTFERPLCEDCRPRVVAILEEGETPPRGPGDRRAMIATCERCSRPALLVHYPHGPRCAWHLREAYDRIKDPEVIELRMLEGDTSAPRAIATSVRIAVGPAHERISVWSRGGRAGELVVQGGDALTIAMRLLGVARGGE